MPLLTFTMILPSRQKSQSLSSGDTGSRSKGPQNNAAIDRYVREKDGYKEFLVNGPRDSPTGGQPGTQDMQELNQPEKHTSSKVI